jgi:hypothetical protein
MPDFYSNPYCRYPSELDPPEVIVDLTTDLGVAKTFGPFTVKQCDGREFTTITNMTTPEGLTPPSAFTFSGGILTVTITSADSSLYVGATHLHFDAQVYYKKVKVGLQVIIKPKASYVKDPTSSSNHDFSNCPDKIYPFLYGGHSAVVI